MTLEDVCYLIVEVLYKSHISEHESIAFKIVDTLNELGVYTDSCGRRLLLDACQEEDILEEMVYLLSK